MTTEILKAETVEAEILTKEQVKALRTRDSLLKSGFFELVQAYGPFVSRP
jgi:hypothetical protein